MFWLQQRAAFSSLDIIPCRKTITADVPSEAELTPKLWGKWKLVAE